MAEWIIEIKDGKFPIGKWSPLVRCKDCILYNHCSIMRECEFDDNDYCSRGERKDGGVNG